VRVGLFRILFSLAQDDGFKRVRSRQKILGSNVEDYGKFTYAVVETCHESIKIA
jgi:hypothetical protein